MALPPIQLDDRTFEQLQTELRRRIPAYTPEWTDHNESDPGITLMQLFAWLGEMIIYRLNKVPQKNYQAFLELVGIDPELPKAATAELTFKVSRKGYGVMIPAGTQAQASGGSGGSVVFTTGGRWRGCSLGEMPSEDTAVLSTARVVHTRPAASQRRMNPALPPNRRREVSSGNS